MLSPCGSAVRQSSSLSLGGEALEDGASLLESAHDVDVVHDLLAHVDGLPVVQKRALNRVDGPLDSGAIAAGRGQKDLLYQTAGQDSPGLMKTV